MARSATKPALKRFLIFSGDQFYPNGGWRDFRGSYSTLKSARAAPKFGDWWQVIDSKTGTIVEEG